MSKFYVTKTVYLGQEVEAETEEQAIEIAQRLNYINWDFNDEDEPEVEEDNDDDCSSGGYPGY